MRRNGSDRSLDRFSTQASSTMTAQMTVLQLMLTLFDRNIATRVLCNHVHMIHVMHIWTRMRGCLVVTERELMLNGALAALATHCRCDGCRQKRKQHDYGCSCTHCCLVQYKQLCQAPRGGQRPGRSSAWCASASHNLQNACDEQSYGNHADE
jgi:hypothetical protein